MRKNPLIIFIRSSSAILSAIIISIALLPASTIAADHNSAVLSPSLMIRTPDTTPRPSPYRHSVDLSKGKFLVAKRHMGDPRFAKTVILLIKYDWDGAMGVIINRPTDIKLSEALPEFKGFSKKTDPIFWGGPVATQQAVTLIRSLYKPEETVHVLDDVYFSSSRTVFEKISDGKNFSESFRVYLGYAGWSPRQLDREIIRGDWRVLQADAKTIFNKSPRDIWQELILLDTSQQVMAR